MALANITNNILTDSGILVSSLQGALTLTTTGSSGASTLIGNTLNIPNYGGGLTGYVPYTGATGSVNLGTNDLTSRYLVANGSAGLGGVLNIKQDAAYSPLGNGFSSIASSSNSFDFFGYTGASTYKNFQLRFDGLTNNTVRTYTLPDASGTIALTSALSGMVTGTGTTNYLPKFTGTSTIGNSNVQDNGSTVSISTNSTVLSLDRTGAGTALIELKTNGTVRSYFGADVSVPFIFFTQSASELMRLNASGNLSLGNTNNTYKLDVSGDGTFSGFVNANVYNLAGLTGGGALSWTTNTLRLGQDSYFQNLQFWTNGSIKMRLDTSGNLGLGVTPSAWQFFKAVQVSAGNSFVGYNNQAEIWSNSFYDGASKYYANGFATRYAAIDGRFEWYQAPSGTAGNAISFTQAMTLNASGNLSIGNTNDTYKLDVTGTGRFLDDLNLDTSAANTQRGLIFRDAGTVKWQVYKSTANDFRIYRQGSSNDALIIGTNDAATFSSSVTATQFVANGASTVPNLILNGPSTTWTRYQTSGTDRWDIGNNVGGLSSNQFSFYSNGASSNVFVIQQNGNVGIGTTTPTSYSGFTTLNINNGTNGGVIDLLNNGTRVGTFFNTSTYVAIGSIANVPLYFYANNSEAMRITSGGSVLIGTSTEGFLGKLQVAGSVAITGQYNTVLPSSSFSYFDGSGQVVSASSNASALYLDTTWNTTGNPDGIYLNVTNTASGASSKLLNLKVGSVSQFSVSKAGAIQTTAPTGGTAQPWKLGTVYTGTCVPNSFGDFTSWFTGTVIEIEVNGTTYKIPAIIDNYC